jgi:ABC-type glycerol-3-phosphate transport system substrate-binding protein
MGAMKAQGRATETRPARSTGRTRRDVSRGALATAVVAVALGGTACGGEQPPRSEPAQPVTLEFMHRWDASRTPLVEQQVKAFEAEHPKITINNQMVFGSGDGFRDGFPYDKVFAMIVGGTPPDVFMTLSFIAVDFALKGALRPVDDLLQRDRLDPTKTFYPALARAGQVGGKTIALPQMTGTDRSYLVWNTAAYREAGLDPNAVARDWNDLVEFTRKINRKEGDTLTRMGLPFPRAPFMDWHCWQGRNGGKVLSEDGAKVLFNDPIGVETLQFIVDATQRLYGTRQVAPAFVSASNLPSPRAGFYDGRWAMRIESTAIFGLAKDEAPAINPSFKMGVALAPPSKASTKATYLSDRIYMYAMGNGTKQAEPAYAWLKYLTAGEGNRAFTRAQLRPSPVPKYNDDPALRRESPDWDTIIKVVTSTEMIPQTPAWLDVVTLLEGMADQVLDGKGGTREVLSQTAAEAQRLLDAAPKLSR